jgi:hypothetical protein
MRKQRLPFSEIISEAAKKRTKVDKKEFLQSHDCVPLRIILRLWYDETLEWLVPDSAPPYKKGETADEGMMLYHEARKLRIFIKGGGYDQLKPAKRESLFIGLLEDLYDPDAEMLCQMITNKPYKGLTKQTVEDAFPRLFIDPLKIN